MVEKIIDLLKSLYSYGFSKPIVSQDDWSTSIIFKLTNIALEIELDWRDFNVFVLVVRMERGNLPSGYYVSAGKPCRYHLQKVISDRRWNVDQEAFAELTPKKNSRRQKILWSEDMMFDRFLAYKIVLDDCVDKLRKEESMIFEVAPDNGTLE